MKIYTYIWGICALLISGSVGAYDVQFSQTLVKMLGGQNNQISLSIKNDGTIQTEFPTYAPHAKTTVAQLNIEKQQKLISHIENLIKTKANPNVQRKLAVVKSKQSGLFYSSESDVISIQIFDDERLLWTINLDNFHELEYYYEHLGEWQVLVDLIHELNEVIKEQKQQLIGGKS
jgi:hypothetical protein